MDNYYTSVKIIYILQDLLEKADRKRDKMLFSFIKYCWPRFITPNHLTIARIFIGLFLFVLLFYSNQNSKALIISLFAVGAITDLLDGSIARTLNKETKVGIMLDPAADRILIIPIVIYSLFNSHRWLFLSIIVLEIMNALVSIFAAGKNVLVKSNIFGKIKMALHSIVFAGILIFWPKAPHITFINILWISIAILVISIYAKIVQVNQLLNAEHHKDIQ